MYKGNIEKLRKSIYLREDSKKNRGKYNKKKKAKIISNTAEQYRNLIASMFLDDAVEEKVEKKEVLVEDRLQNIRSKYTEEIKIHGEHTKIKEGFVYIVYNERFPGWVKAGMTIDYEKRLSVYNLYDPESNFKMIVVKWVEDRRLLERFLLEELAKIAECSKGEWFKVDKDIALSLF